MYPAQSIHTVPKFKKLININLR